MAKQKYIGEFPHDTRQLANILWQNKNILVNFLTTFANWRIYCGKTKICWRISSRHSPIGEYTKARANIFFYVQLSRACALYYLRMHIIELAHNALCGNLFCS